MKTHHPAGGTAYATGYARGRHDAKENISTAKNPFRAGTASYQGWNDGHYDERSARFVAIERHSAQLWSRDGSEG